MTDVGEEKGMKRHILQMDKMFDKKRSCEILMPPSQAGEGYRTLSYLGLEERSRVIPVYKPGDVIKGRVTLDLRKPLKAKELRIVATGYASICNNILEGYGSEKCMEKKIVLWNRDESWTPAGDELRHPDSLPFGDKIPHGNHVFSFEIPIPPTAVSSCQPIHLYEGCSAYIVYRLAAVIDRENHYERPNIIALHGFWVEDEADIAAEPDGLKPLIVKELFETGVFGTSGALKCTAKLPARAFLRTDRIVLYLDVSNHTPYNIGKVKARIVLKGQFKTGRLILERKMHVRHKSRTAECGAIVSNTTRSYRADLDMDFDKWHFDNNLLPSDRNMEKSGIINMTYAVEIEFHRNCFHRTIKMTIPIVVGNMNSAQQPYPRRSNSEM